MSSSFRVGIVGRFVLFGYTPMHAATTERIIANQLKPSSLFSMKSLIRSSSSAVINQFCRSSKREKTGSTIVGHDPFRYDHHHHHQQHRPHTRNHDRRTFTTTYHHNRSYSWESSSPSLQDSCCGMPRRVTIVEVGPRDGLQNEKQFVSTEHKVQLIQQLYDAGCYRIEATSFVSPKWVPNMKDASDVMYALQSWKQQQSVPQQQRQLLDLSCLVPNLQGFHRAIQVGGMSSIAIFASVSEEFSQKNIHCSIEESMERYRQVMEVAKDHNIPVRGYISCVLGCPYTGYISPQQVAYVAQTFDDMGCYEISLGDTIGVGTPGATRQMIECVQKVVTTKKLAVHFHDTYGQALANILVSLQHGISIVDTSVSGLGGCPYAPGAAGNVATEDVVYMLNGMSIETGINLDKLMDAGNFICNVLGRKTQSKVARALTNKKRTDRACSVTTEATSQRDL